MFDTHPSFCLCEPLCTPCPQREQLAGVLYSLPPPRTVSLCSKSLSRTLSNSGAHRAPNVHRSTHVHLFKIAFTHVVKIRGTKGTESTHFRAQILHLLSTARTYVPKFGGTQSPNVHGSTHVHLFKIAFHVRCHNSGDQRDRKHTRPRIESPSVVHSSHLRSKIRGTKGTESTHVRAQILYLLSTARTYVPKNSGTKGTESTHVRA